MSKVYLIRCVKNDTHYIGSTRRSVNERYKEHLSHARRRTKPSPLYADIRLYGERDFEISILEELPVSGESTIDRRELIQREQYWIDHHRQSGVSMYNKNDALSDQTSYDAIRYRNKIQTKREYCQCGAWYCPSNRYHHQNASPHQNWQKTQLLHLQPDCL